MFEDMAALFNLVKRENEAAASSANDKILIKQRNAPCRSAVIAAIHFVESYLNGVSVYQGTQQEARSKA
jgi:hypothetical protein